MAVSQSPVYQEVFEFLISAPTPEQIIAFQPSDVMQKRVRELLQANKEDRLTQEEEAELDEFANINHFMSMLKIYALNRYPCS